MNSAAFFAYAREREAIRLRREAGHPPPWTDDRVLQLYRFCNVFREDDTTTRWIAHHLRQPLDDAAHPSGVLWACHAARSVNSIATMTRLLPWLRAGPSAWDHAAALAAIRHQKPVTNSAYIVMTPAGMPKAAGVCWLIDQFSTRASDYAMDIARVGTLQHAHSRLMELPYMGPFMAYEVVTDLAHTSILGGAPDRFTWASAGPGAARGLARLLGLPVGGRGRAAGRCGLSYGSKADQARMVAHMVELLDMSRDPACWPRLWPTWDMRTVEHTLCEFDKYERATNGGHGLRRFRAYDL